MARCLGAEPVIVLQGVSERFPNKVQQPLTELDRAGTIVRASSTPDDRAPARSGPSALVVREGLGPLEPTSVGRGRWVGVKS